MTHRILIFHGYLLRGTGSNIYNANLARALTQLGHEVHLFSQEQHPETLDFVDAWADCDGSTIHLRSRREPRFAGRCTVYRPNIAGLLPVYVLDPYEGFEVRTFPELTDAELARYLALNIAAVQGVVSAVAPEFALANHEIMGPYIFKQALATLANTLPYAVKIHGSALEYTVKPHPRFLPYAREGILGASAVLVGSADMAARLFSVIDEPELRARVRLAPPGVDGEAFAPRDRQARITGLHHIIDSFSHRERTGFGQEASRALDTLAEQARTHPDQSEWEWSQLPTIQQTYDPDGIDEQAPQSLSTLDLTSDSIIAFVGKLLLLKGIDLLLCAWPLVLAQIPTAQLLVVGFGSYREPLELLLRAFEREDLAAIRRIAEHGQDMEGSRLDHQAYIETFFASLVGERRHAYFRAARTMRRSLVFTGKLDHAALVDVLPLAAAMVVPSTYPEAFGLVTIEATACGVWPIVANHAALAEVAASLSQVVPPNYHHLLSFDLSPNMIQDIAARITAWLALPPDERTQLTTAIRELTVKKWSWQGVAQRVLAACAGRLDELPTLPQ